MTFLDELLNKTTLDDKAAAALKNADKYLHERRHNLKFVVSKYPIATSLIAISGALVGVLIGAIFF